MTDLDMDSRRVLSPPTPDDPPEEPVGEMQSFGADPQSMRTDIQRMDRGHGIWVMGGVGMELPKKELHADGRWRRCDLLIGVPPHRWVRFGTVYFGGDGRRVAAEFDLIEALTSKLLRDDAKAIQFVRNYANRFPDLTAVDWNREWPTQLPYYGQVLLRPADVEVIDAVSVPTTE